MHDGRTSTNRESIWSMGGRNITIGYENVAYSVEELAARLNDYFYVAMSGDQAVGYCFGEIREGKASPAIPHGEQYLEIFELYVHPEHRRQGLGKRLVSELPQKAENNHIKRSLLGSSNRRWRETAEFYERLVIECGIFRCLNKSRDGHFSRWEPQLPYDFAIVPVDLFEAQRRVQSGSPLVAVPVTEPDSEAAEFLAHEAY